MAYMSLMFVFRMCSDVIQSQFVRRANDCSLATLVL